PADSVKWIKSAESIKNNLDKLYTPEGYFVKGFLRQPDGSLAYDNTLDISSLYGPFMYGGLELDDERITSTAQQIEKRLLNMTPIGGVVRYEHDNYFLSKPKYPGNPWVVSTLWLAQYYATINKVENAKKLLDWALSRQLKSNALSEQFDPETGAPLGVVPLVWSHAELVNTILDLAKYSNA